MLILKGEELVYKYKTIFGEFIEGRPIITREKYKNIIVIE